MSYIGNKPADTIATSADISDGAITAAKLASASVTQPKINGGVAGTGPAFSAYNSAIQAISNNTTTKLVFNTEKFDTNSNFDTTTSRFTPTVEGYYSVTGCIYFPAAATGGAQNCYIYKNGSLYHLSQSTPNTSGVSTIANGLIYMNGTTDYLEIYGYINSGGLNLIANRPDLTYFEASMVRAA